MAELVQELWPLHVERAADKMPLPKGGLLAAVVFCSRQVANSKAKGGTAVAQGLYFMMLLRRKVALSVAINIILV